VVSGNGYVAPLPDGGHAVGASYQHDDPDPRVRPDDHRANLARAESLLPGFTAGLDASTLAGWTGFRATVPDRLPIFGESSTEGVFVATGLGSRGLLWAPLGAELVASALAGDPLPLPATSAARFPRAGSFPSGRWRGWWRRRPRDDAALHARADPHEDARVEVRRAVRRMQHRVAFEDYEDLLPGILFGGVLGVVGGELHEPHLQSVHAEVPRHVQELLRAGVLAAVHLVDVLHRDFVHGHFLSSSLDYPPRPSSSENASMRPDLTSLALFVRIAEARSITRAAKASHIALAAASRRIAQLEDQLGASLLYRTARGVELTPAGQALLGHAREMLEKVGEMRAAIADYSKGVKGVVRIHANASALASTFRTTSPPSPNRIRPSRSRSRRSAAARSSRRCRRAPPTSASSWKAPRGLSSSSSITAPTCSARSSPASIR
jgi:molybdenum-dependent DNA-binding transcriptional regulator ModE